MATDFFYLCEFIREGCINGSIKSEDYQTLKESGVDTIAAVFSSMVQYRHDPLCIVYFLSGLEEQAHVCKDLATLTGIVYQNRIWSRSILQEHSIYKVEWAEEGMKLAGTESIVWRKPKCLIHTS